MVKKVPDFLYGVSIYYPKVRKFIKKQLEYNHYGWVAAYNRETEDWIHKEGWGNSHHTYGETHFASTNKEEVKKVAKMIRKIKKDFNSLIDRHFQLSQTNNDWGISQEEKEMYARIYSRASKFVIW